MDSSRGNYGLSRLNTIAALSFLYLNFTLFIYSLGKRTAETCRDMLNNGYTRAVLRQFPQKFKDSGSGWGPKAVPSPMEGIIVHRSSIIHTKLPTSPRSRTRCNAVAFLGRIPV